MKITFKNGKELNYIYSLVGNQFYNGANRNTITVEIDTKEISLTELDELISNPENVSEIKLQNLGVVMLDEKGQEVSTDIEHIYHGYVIEIEVAKRVVERPLDALNLESTRQEVLTFTLGKQTETEIKMAKIEELLLAQGIKL